MKPVKVGHRNIAMAVCSNRRCLRKPSYGETVFKICGGVTGRTRYLCADCGNNNTMVEQMHRKRSLAEEDET